MRATEEAPRPAPFSPRPGAAPLHRMIGAQAAVELRTMLRNGEQLLLTLAIPVLLLVLLSALPVFEIGTTRRVDFFAPGIIALAVMSTAFTGQAINVGFERRYGVLKRLGATPLPRSGLLAAKTASVVVVEVIQVAILAAVAFGLGWHPYDRPLAAFVLVVLGTAAFSGLGLLMAGTLRAEATLAAANLVYIVLLALGGVIVPLTAFPAGAQTVLGLLPISALADGLRTVLQHGGTLPLADVVTLAVWAVVAIAAAATTFRWE
ncbi:MAG: ABC transporter permease [Streptosporangiaceae bacterium]